MTPAGFRAAALPESTTHSVCHLRSYHLPRSLPFDPQPEGSYMIIPHPLRVAASSESGEL